jgi:hypothetical protein
MFLDEFFEIFPPGANLTRSETKINICKDDNVFLSTLIASVADPVNAYKIILYNNLGIEIGNATGFLNSSPFVGSIFTFNCGVEGLKNLVPNQQTAGFNFNDPNLYYYTLDIGLFGLGIFAPVRNQFTYYLKGCNCCENRRFRLHWLNELGGVDSYTFCSIKELRQKTTDTVAERSLAWIKTGTNPHNITDVGQFKTQTQNESFYKIISKDLTNKKILWLSEILGSVKVYLEIDKNKFVPVIIQGSEQLIQRQNGKIKLELSVKLGYNRITQKV